VKEVAFENTVSGPTAGENGDWDAIENMLGWIELRRSSAGETAGSWIKTMMRTATNRDSDRDDVRILIFITLNPWT
jgi:hypothetical protein